MTAVKTRNAAYELTLPSRTAAELMSSNPVSIRDDATVREAMGCLLDKSIGAAPVIDEAGKPVGVVSRTDLLLHEREYAHHHTAASEGLRTPPTHGRALPEGYEIEDADPTLVRDVMTPAVIAVETSTSAVRVINEMRNMHVHRLFVVDETGTLVGVISTLDILRHLRLPEED